MLSGEPTTPAHRLPRSPFSTSQWTSSKRPLIDERGVHFKRLDDFAADEKRIARGRPPTSRRSRTPAGNVLSVLQNG